MKIYLNSTQVAELWLQQFTKLLNCNPSPATTDEIVEAVITKHRTEVVSVMVDSLYNIETQPNLEIAVDTGRFLFQKTFRQRDVFATTLLDRVMYIALNDAPQFWSAHRHVYNIAVDETLSNYYIDMTPIGVI